MGQAFNSALIVEVTVCQAIYNSSADIHIHIISNILQRNFQRNLPINFQCVMCRIILLHAQQCCQMTVY